MSAFADDLKHAARLCRRSPGFMTFAVGSLAIAIGSATLVFSLVHQALVRSLPFRDPAALVWMYNARTERDRAPFSVPDLDDYQRENSTLAGVAVFTNWGANLTGIGPAERIEGTRVGGNFFQLLGAQPLIGRTLEPADEANNARVAVLAHGFWTRRFGRDPSIVGRDVLLNGAQYTVVGVLTPDFMFPFRDAELAVPVTIATDPRRTDRGANFLRVVARLNPGVTLQRAKEDLDAIARRLQQQYPEEDARKTGVNLFPLHAEIVRDYAQILWILFAAVAVFLVIGCGNLANLMFVRSIARAREFALRASLGAPGWRIARQLAVEASFVAGLGGIGGAILAAFGLSLWRVVEPANFPRRDAIALDAAALTFTIAVSLCVALVCTIVPARAAIRSSGARAAGGTRTQTGTRRERAVRHAFVAAQAAGSVLLLTCMGLASQGLARLEEVDAGFTPANALSMQLSLPPRTYRDAASIERFDDALRARFTSIGGIRAAGAVSLRPLSGLLSTMDVAFPDRPAPPPDEVPQAHFRIASAGYFSAAGIRVLAGREFTAEDRAGSQRVAIVSRTFADRHWPGATAIGRSVQIVQSAPSRPMEVVGVVSDVKQFGVDGSSTADLYVPLPQMPASQAPLVAARIYWIVRTDGDPRQFALRVREIVQSVDGDVAASNIQSLREVLDGSIAGWRANVRLLEAFAPLASLLCAAGVYAVASFSASARQRELAIRAALGATRRELTTRMVGEEMRPLAIGLAIGLAASVVAAPELGALLFKTSPLEPWPYALAALSLLGIGTSASYLPARRAGSSDPSELLRLS
ncbi:MAG TPA: ABC transporter permease [Vicinamibacterales bacterium]